MPGLLPNRTASASAFLALAIVANLALSDAQTGPATGSQQGSQLSIPLISAQEMAPEDRAAAESWGPSIARSAQFFGYNVDSSYTYREIACPVAAQHLLLAYEATAANGATSRFSAVVLRGLGQEVAGSHPAAQIIPILRSGMVPFVPAIANPHSIEVFNAAISPAPSAIEVLSANQEGNQPLLVRALCFLAMVGEEPAALASPSLSQATIHAPIPTLVFTKDKIRQLISIRDRQNSYQVWALTFQPGGKLLTATRQEHPIDRTPLVLSAADSGPPPTSTSPNKIPSDGAKVSPEPLQPVAPLPTAALATVAPASRAIAVPAQPAPPPPPVATRVPIDAPAAPAPVPTTGASKTGPVAPSLPMQAEAPPPAVPAATVVEPAAVASAPQPPVAANAAPAAAAPERASVSSSLPISATPASSVPFADTPPAVKRSPPLPPGRFIPHPAQPPSKFIPDSALKTPPHLPQ